MSNEKAIIDSLEELERRDSEVRILGKFIRDLFKQREILGKLNCFMSHETFCLHKDEQTYSPRIELSQFPIDPNILVGKVIVVTKQEGDITYKLIEELVGPADKGLSIFDYLISIFTKHEK